MSGIILHLMEQEELCLSSKAKESLNIEEYKKSMSGVYTTSVNEATLDEAADGI